MKQVISELLQVAVEKLQAQGVLPNDFKVDPVLERTRDKTHGDWASNIALVGARYAKCAPKVLAEQLLAALPASDSVSKVEIAGPGFINFFLQQDAQQAVIKTVLSEKENYGLGQAYANQKIILEFISANPTGPLHVGHGRWAAMGAAVANLLEAQGAEVHREYYVNDAGRQMDILAVSTWLRYLELQPLSGVDFSFPLNAYRGDYIIDMAKTLQQAHGQRFVVDLAALYQSVCENTEENREQHIDELIVNAKHLLQADYQVVFDAALQAVLGDIKDDVQEFGVPINRWFSEHDLVKSGAVNKALSRLNEAGHTYEKEGALWLKTTAYGDDKDRVLVRNNGQHTYFTPDIAYHMDKLDRGYDLVIDLFGADHHGYVARMRAAMQALGANADRYQVLLGQFVNLFRNGGPVQMSTRSGSFVSLRELRSEVGNDAAHFFYLMRKFSQTLDFDLTLATSKSNDNPVYYVQYAHARICSVLQQMTDKKITLDLELGQASLQRLTEAEELALMKQLSIYPDMLKNAACQYEPHLVANYLRNLANEFHTYYNAHQFLVTDMTLCQARLCLVLAVKQVLVNALTLLGISAPQAM